MPHVVCFLDVIDGVVAHDIVDVAVLVVVVVVVMLLLLLSLAAVAGRIDCQRVGGFGVDARVVRLELIYTKRTTQTETKE